MDDIQEGVMLHIYKAVALSLIFALALPGMPASAAFASALNGNPGAFDMNAVNGSLARAKEFENTLKVPENGNQQEADEEAQKAFEIYRSEAFQQRLAKETERLKSEVFKGIKTYYKDVSGGSNAGENRLSPNERIYLFISSSVPEATLRTYMEQIAGLRDPNIAVVTRGFIDGMKYIGPTLEFIQKLLEKDPSCGEPCGLNGVNVEVDPLLFRRYGILQVPAVVYVPDIEVAVPGASEGLEQNATVARSYAFYGDVSLAYALQRINEKAKSASLAAVIKEFNHGFYK